MNKPPPSRRRLAIILSALFVFSLLMGPGPGMLLANSPRPVFGLPMLYMWGCFWYLVQVGIVVAAYIWLWRDA